MAFHPADSPQHVSWAEEQMPRVVRGLRQRHLRAVGDLLQLAETPADANTALAAVAKWRTDQRERGETFWRNMALLQITSGDRPDDVCAELGFGRTALQRAVHAEGSKLAAHANLLYEARPKRKREVS